ncbi:hypothetical protein J3R82DRAFT_8820 [Butyriboletus roseoflavus]|nr:hypothetical protein J3R82DRAFT_8820 [Butyriboletus roseoflavus]
MSIAVSYSLQDAQRLVSIASSPELNPHTCRWAAGGVRCGTAVQGIYFPTHLRDAHGIYGVGYRSLGFLCQWENCSDASTFNKEGLMRHIQEKHLLWRWLCPSCGAAFTGKVARNTHLALCGGAR